MKGLTCRQCDCIETTRWYDKTKKEPICCKCYAHNRRKNDKEVIKENQEKYNSSKKGRNREKSYSKSSKGRVSGRSRTSKFRHKDERPDWVDSSMITKVYREAKRLEDETGIKHEVDHIIPLKHLDVCGLDIPVNLQILTAFENRSKRNKFDGTNDNTSWKRGRDNE